MAAATAYDNASGRGARQRRLGAAHSCDGQGAEAVEGCSGVVEPVRDGGRRLHKRSCTEQAHNRRWLHAAAGAARAIEGGEEASERQHEVAQAGGER